MTSEKNADERYVFDGHEPHAGDASDSWPENQKTRGKNFYILLILILLFFIAGLILVWQFLLKPKTAPAPLAYGKGSGLSNPVDRSLAESVPDAALEPFRVSLADSDALLQKEAADLSPVLVFPAWLKQKDLIRRFVAVVVNVAAGESPAAHLEFLEPKEKFPVLREGGGIYLDPAGCQRYDEAVRVVASLDEEKCRRLYVQARPLLEEAYKELGYPQANFQRTLIQAIQQVLQTPVVRDKIRLQEKVATYAFADGRLENLNAARKHLLRMGPTHLIRIQQKLRALAKAIGISVGALPQ